MKLDNKVKGKVLKIMELALIKKWEKQKYDFCRIFWSR
jgi:hypothetical protein